MFTDSAFFHDGDELDELSLHPVPEEPVHLQGLANVGRADAGQDVELDPVRRQRLQPTQHPVEGRLAAAITTVGIVKGNGLRPRCLKI